MGTLDQLYTTWVHKNKMNMYPHVMAMSIWGACFLQSIGYHINFYIVHPIQHVQIHSYQSTNINLKRNWDSLHSWQKHIIIIDHLEKNRKQQTRRL